MTPSIDSVEADALQLTAAERTDLVERPIATLEPDPAVEAYWVAEVERRDAEIERGEVSELPGPKTLAELKAEFA